MIRNPFSHVESGAGCRPNLTLQQKSNFVGRGEVQVFVMQYDELDAVDYDAMSQEDCGPITNCGYNVLQEYALDITNQLGNHLVGFPDQNFIQFRIQYTDDANRDPQASDLENCMWNIFAGEEGALTDY